MAYGARWSLVLLALGLAGCQGEAWLRTRRLHYVDGHLVASNPPAPMAYEAYLRARVALERGPEDLHVAAEHINEALRWSPGDPLLWTTRAEIAYLAGDLPTANLSLGRALALRPGFPPALALERTLRGTDASTP